MTWNVPINQVANTSRRKILDQVSHHPVRWVLSQ
jgi:hypothetical protein